jgi:hypothetical protein
MSQTEAAATEPTPEDPYALGRRYGQLPIPPVPERCIDLPAGPVIYMVESRDLTEDLEQFDGFGGTVHVLDASDRTEYLRFDCFENIPHYHYIHPAEGSNTLVRIDDVAVGDPTEWVLGRLRDRLPDMLDHAGATALADAVRADRATAADAVDELTRLLRKANQRASEHRASGVSLAPAP